MDCEFIPYTAPLFLYFPATTDLFFLTDIFKKRFDAWIRSLDFYSGNDLLYLSPSGTIPDAAVIKKGMKREKPFKERKVFDSTSFPDKDKLDSYDLVDDEDDDLPINKRDLAETEG
jgi:tRNA pseudouridine38-40 synthase